MPAPSYIDGLQSLASLTASCLNNSKTYMCFGFSPKVEASQKKFVDQSLRALGSDTQAGGHVEGTLALQLDLATDEVPSPAYIFLFGTEYFVAGGNDAPKNSHDVVKVNVQALKVVNPIISTLVSSLGQLKAATHAGSGGTVPYTLDCDAVNTRVGATLAWSLVGAPAGMSINASTGVITYSTPVIGTYTIEVQVTDTVAGEVVRGGKGFLKLTVSS